MISKKYSKGKVIPYNECTGCALCTYICPSQCITMVEGKLGHLFPSVDNQKCIHCNLCVKTCPSNNQFSFHYPFSAYAAWAKDDGEYISSTSGGAASVFSREIIKRGGVVYGCTMTSDCVVKHIRVDNEERLQELKGSKYAQSNIRDIYHLLKEDIRLGLPVLFIGTPCQVAAIKSLFKSEPDNLFLIDIICHGVPSLRVLHDYLNNKFGRSSFDSLSFRQGSRLNMVIMNEGKTIYNAYYKDDLYYKLFMFGFTYRDSCHQCQYAQPNRVSDVTIGDFWGLGKKGDCNIPDHKHGVSVILPISEKGNALVQRVRGSLNIYERPVEEAIQGNSQLMAPSSSGKRIELFQMLEPIFGLDKAYKFAHFDSFIKNIFR